MNKPTDEEPTPWLGIEASARAEELSVRKAANTKVIFTGEGKVATRRVNLPSRGAHSGQVYRRAFVTTRIHAVAPQVERVETHRSKGRSKVAPAKPDRS